MNSVLQVISQEIRIRLSFLSLSVICTWIHCYYFSEEFLFLLIRPFLRIFSNNNNSQNEDVIFLCTQLTEKFHTYIILSFILCIVFSFPYCVYQIWSFLIPSCYNEKRKEWNLFFVRSAFFFLITFAITFEWIVPSIWLFFSQFYQDGDLFTIQLQPRIYEYVMLTLRVCFVCCICSQIPVLIILLLESQLLSIQSLTQNRSKMLPVALLIAALFTPPDLMCQLAAFFPMVFLLETTIFYGIMQNQIHKVAR